MDFLIETSPGPILPKPDYEVAGFKGIRSINASTPRDLLGTAFLAYDADLLSQIATVLNNRMMLRGIVRSSRTQRPYLQSLPGGRSQWLFLSSHLRSGDNWMPRIKFPREATYVSSITARSRRKCSTLIYLRRLRRRNVLALHFDLLPRGYASDRQRS
ncbi:MAG: hypothetical protein IPM16_23990 [Chloroflexi bacterium]|nr:hypothetical protein [Chloroflexota bacterium]